MTKIIIKIFILFLPIVIILGYIEYRLSKMHNSYQIKRSLFEQNLSEIEILSLGSSNAYYGVNPSYFDLKGFNLAYRAQSHWYDTRITLRYIDKMPKLRIVIIPIVYLTFGTTPDDLADKWRVFFYEQTYGISPSPKTAMKAYGFFYWLDARRFSLIALYGERTSDYVEHGFRDNIGEKIEPNGWFDSGEKPMDPSLDIGPNGARAHNSMVKTERYEDNLLYIKALTDELKKRNIIPVLLQLAANKEITDYFDEKKIRRMNQVLETFALKNGIKNINYMYDSRFDATDFTDMPDHLNRKGAEKISKIINHDLVSIK
jgi:hypothetical protein